MASFVMNATRSHLRVRPITPFTVLRTPTIQPQVRTLPTSKPSPRLYSTRADSLPRIIQPSFWASLVPKFVRNRPSPSPEAAKNREWNPASFYIIIFILIGSQAIRMIALKNEYKNYVRSTDAKIRLLREVIGKVQNGEQVDVEKMLGRGDKKVEREWNEVLREIEREDSLWHQKQKAASDTLAQQQEQAQAQTQTQTAKDPAVPAVDTTDESTAKDSQTKRKVNFF
ncbi:hypothetical protein BDV18DRAFT_140171 [Aspergillus unguis]